MSLIDFGIYAGLAVANLFIVKAAYHKGRVSAFLEAKQIVRKYGK